MMGNRNFNKSLLTKLGGGLQHHFSFAPIITSCIHTDLRRLQRLYKVKGSQTPNV